MRITHVLRAQHIGFRFKKNWIFQRVKRPHDTRCEEYLKEKGFQVHEANEYINNIENEQKLSKMNFNIDIVGMKDKVIPYDEKHPEYKSEVCRIMGDKNVLIEGLAQAQVLTKTHIVSTERLPEKIETVAQEEHSEAIHEQVKKIILFSNVFDCEQKKLPHIKDPERPAYNFPRILGITDARKNLLMATKLINLLDKTSGISDQLQLNRDVQCVTTFKKDNDLFQIDFNANSLITSNMPLDPIKVDYKEWTVDVNLPSLYPITHRASFQTENFYKIEDIYPIRGKSSKWFHPHTTILHYNPTQVQNLHELPVTETQLWGRSLMHSFAIAASYAKSLYGEDVQLLLKPVVIQCIQTDGCNYYMGVFQLNNLDLSGTDGVKNLWYQTPIKRMFDICKYLSARPYLDGYNPSIYNYLSAFYRNT